MLKRALIFDIGISYNYLKFQMSMSVKLAMVAVNKSATTQMAHLSAHVIGALVCHLTVQAV